MEPQLNQYEIEQLLLEFQYSGNSKLIRGYLEDHNLFAQDEPSFFSDSYKETIRLLGSILPALSVNSVLYSLSNMLLGKITNLGLMENTLIAEALTTHMKDARIIGQKINFDFEKEETLVLATSKKKYVIATIKTPTIIRNSSLRFLGLKLTHIIINCEPIETIYLPPKKLLRLLDRTEELLTIVKDITLRRIIRAINELYGVTKHNEKMNLEEIIIRGNIIGFPYESLNFFYLHSLIETLYLVGDFRLLLGVLRKPLNNSLRKFG